MQAPICVRRCIISGGIKALGPRYLIHATNKTNNTTIKTINTMIEGSFQGFVMPAQSLTSKMQVDTAKVNAVPTQSNILSCD